MKDPDSIFNFYKEIINLRHHHDVISKGSIEFIDLDHPHLFNYVRKYEGETYLCINNFFSITVDYAIEGTFSEIILSNYDKIEKNKHIVLRPYETLVLKL